MGEQLRSIVLGTTGLSLAAVIAIWLTVARHGIAADKMALRTAVRVAALAILVQAAHFAEEVATGFDHRFPSLLGLTPWPLVFFVSFNVFWLAVWSLSVWGLRARRRAALFPLWFLGLGCIANGLAHPGLAVITRGYFPGLVTAPFVGIVGILLLRRLCLITEERRYTVAAAEQRVEPTAHGGCAKIGGSGRRGSRAGRYADERAWGAGQTPEGLRLSSRVALF